MYFGFQVCSTLSNSPQLSLEPINVTFLGGKKTYADVLRTLRWGEICWIIQVTPKYHNKCLHKRETGKFHHTHASTHAGEGGVKVEQGVIQRCWPRRLEWCGHKPRSASSNKKLEETMNRSSPQASGGSAVNWNLDFGQWYWFQTSGLKNCERTNFYCFKPSSLW